MKAAWTEQLSRLNLMLSLVSIIAVQGLGAHPYFKEGSNEKSRGERSDVAEGLAPKLRVKCMDCDFQLSVRLVHLQKGDQETTSFTIRILCF